MAVVLQHPRMEKFCAAFGDEPFTARDLYLVMTKASCKSTPSTIALSNLLIRADYVERLGRDATYGGHKATFFRYVGERDYKPIGESQSEEFQRPRGRER